MTKLRLRVLVLALVSACSVASRGADLAERFRYPPKSARPWVYCFWLEGNVTREGITADLEAMRRAGIGGLLFMDGDMGNPKGPHRFMSESWRAMFKHMVSEASRLRLEINLNNDPGWAGSGGPWVKPEQAAQKVVASETVIQGPARFEAMLAQPPTAQNFYRDIAVLACPAPAADAQGKFRRIENFDSTKSFAGGQDFAAVVPWPRLIPTNPRWPIVPGPQCIASAKVQDLTGRMDQHGRLTWEVPTGRWLVLRIGHTLAGGTTRSSQPEATGLECDKLSKSAIEAHFSAMVGKLLADIGPLAGKTMVSTHVDSWEAGSGNWTAGFRDEFRRRRGYDLLPYLPTLHGLVVDSLEVSERFLWDYRETVCEMLLENYAGHLRELAHQKGLRLSIEAYDGTCDDLRYAGLRGRTDVRVLAAGLLHGPSAVRHRRGNGLGGPRLRPSHPRRRGLHLLARRFPRPSGHAEAAGRLGLLRRGEPLLLQRMDHAALAPARAGRFVPVHRHRIPPLADLVGAVQGMARVRRTLPAHASAGPVRGGRLFPGARGRTAPFCAADSRRRSRRDPRSAAVQLRRLSRGTCAQWHEGPGRTHRVAFRDELSPAGPAELQRRWPAGHARRGQLRVHRQPVAESRRP